MTSPIEEKNHLVRRGTTKAGRQYMLIESLMVQPQLPYSCTGVYVYFDDDAKLEEGTTLTSSELVTLDKKVTCYYVTDVLRSSHKADHARELQAKGKTLDLRLNERSLYEKWYFPPMINKRVQDHSIDVSGSEEDSRRDLREIMQKHYALLVVFTFTERNSLVLAEH